ncbi:MAG: hypothetical protein ACOY90_02560 [Candidatus Zhuqueibacterota bacterium]
MKHAPEKPQSSPNNSEPLLIAKGMLTELHIYENKIQIKTGGSGAIGKLTSGLLNLTSNLIPNKIDKEFLFSEIKAILFNVKGSGAGSIDFILSSDTLQKGKHKRSLYAIDFTDLQKKKFAEARTLLTRKFKSAKPENGKAENEDYVIDCAKCGSLVVNSIETCPACQSEITTNVEKRDVIKKGDDLQKFTKHIGIGLSILLLGIFATAIAEHTIWIGAIIFGGLEFLFGLLGWIVRKTS